MDEDSDEVVPINRLNDDCLELIFSYLTNIADKLRVERVCKRWESLAQNPRLWKPVTTLNFASRQLIGVNTRTAKRRLHTAAFKKILRRCGKNLRELNTSNSYRLSTMAAKHASRYCENLELLEVRKLRLSWPRDSHRGIALIVNCPKLVKIVNHDFQCEDCGKAERSPYLELAREIKRGPNALSYQDGAVVYHFAPASLFAAE